LFSGRDYLNARILGIRLGLLGTVCAGNDQIRQRGIASSEASDPEKLQDSRRRLEFAGTVFMQPMENSMSYQFITDFN
jgi:hypothetical protein